MLRNVWNCVKQIDGRYHYENLNVFIQVKWQPMIIDCGYLQTKFLEYLRLVNNNNNYNYWMIISLNNIRTIYYTKKYESRQTKIKIQKQFGSIDKVEIMQKKFFLTRRKLLRGNCILALCKKTFYPRHNDRGTWTCTILWTNTELSKSDAKTHSNFGPLFLSGVVWGMNRMFFFNDDNIITKYYRH